MRRQAWNHKKAQWTRTRTYSPTLPAFEFMQIFNLACRKTAKAFVWVDVNNMLNKIAEIDTGGQNDGVRELIAVLEWFREHIDFWANVISEAGHALAKVCQTGLSMGSVC